MNIEYDVCGFERNDKMEENKITAEVKQPEKVIFRMPVLPLRGLVLFPHTAMHLEAQRKFSIKAIEYAVSKNVPVLLLTQIDASVGVNSSLSLSSSLDSAGKNGVRSRVCV